MCTKSGITQPVWVVAKWLDLPAPRSQFLVETITKNRPDFFVLLFLQLLNVVGGYDSLGVGTAVAALKACVELKAQGIRDVHQTINAALLVCITLSADSAVPAELGLYEGNPRADRPDRAHHQVLPGAVAMDNHAHGRTHRDTCYRCRSPAAKPSSA
ncbi:hypothetical protein PHYSODRAFT_256165 [Phytophthora sojae]|uniref:Uncharacterized protein n=1 Tax=Phytophthora sojae (strain P6497) TaxID=1094619 RepID=G4ZSF8_PHYSP|nr:hypothetical protein PHYSODRAFT_256165 [Phytophthora sojae]EGZ14038.1 hypothetical protein PHYSODRAFT_256165 [Phytophthora sojae]|eukprot:XP_009531467.1 hypothetical protein PHYSODRAFT_256165 [Phytophthora sojae]